jgi:archaellum biogenesis ATPase FlaH
MNPEKQKLIIEYLLSSADVFTITNNIIEYKYFDPEYRYAVKFIKKYFDQFSALPDLDQVYAESDIQFKHQELTKDKIEYCINEVEFFCQIKAAEKAVFEASEIIAGGKDIHQIKSIIDKASEVAIHKTVGVSFFDDPDIMLDQISSQPAISSGYSLLNDYLGDGLRRTEFLLLAANSGGGKSMVMANIGLNLVEQGYNVLYVSLELSVSMIYKRYVSMVTGINQRDIEKNKQEAAIKIKNAASSNSGMLFIEQMPVGTTSNQLRALLREFELKRKCIPDCIVLDYIDLLGTNDRISADNVNQKDKAASEEFRQILVDYNMIGISASQQNRGGVEAKEVNHSHIAGGISKIQTCDVYISIIFTDIMKQQGEMAFLLLKTRSSDGVGKTVHLSWNANALRVTDPKIGPTGAPVSKFVVTNNELKNAKEAQRNRLLDMFGNE